MATVQEFCPARSWVGRFAREWRARRARGIEWLTNSVAVSESESSTPRCDPREPSLSRSDVARLSRCSRPSSRGRRSRLRANGAAVRRAARGASLVEHARQGLARPRAREKLRLGGATRRVRPSRYTNHANHHAASLVLKDPEPTREKASCTAPSSTTGCASSPITTRLRCSTSTTWSARRVVTDRLRAPGRLRGPQPGPALRLRVEPRQSGFAALSPSRRRAATHPGQRLDPPRSPPAQARTRPDDRHLDGGELE